jgi:hypothetical protein
MKNLPSAEALQKHFDTEHNASAPTADSGVGNSIYLVFSFINVGNPYI